MHLNPFAAGGSIRITTDRPTYLMEVMIMKSISRVLLVTLVLLGMSAPGLAAEPPNVLWIFVDDMSDWLGCYGDELAETPNIDRLAAQGIRFEKAFMPSPVCSTTRSAMITGTIQTTFGLHHHRTMIKEPLPENVLTVPELFRQAGFLTFNETKEDYNFVRDRKRLYSAEFKRPKLRGHPKGNDFSWLRQLRGKRFFGQIQLAGGKIGGETGSKYPAESRLDASKVPLPPYYPDDEVIRNGIARHYEQIAQTDAQVGGILTALKEADALENTIVFFFTDHGSPLPRSKQFLYEEGLKVPLIVSWPAGIESLGGKGSVRNDLVNGIDITTTSLGVAGIEIPETMEGIDFFADDHKPQPFVVGARDRCGIAVDRIRTIRSERYRYIRNYMIDRALYQAQYRDKHASLIRLRKLYTEGKLNTIQAAYHDPSKRVAEELYDLQSDPHQIKNLADDPEFSKVLAQHRDWLAAWVKETDDQGQYPESRESLKAVYKGAKGKVEAPEYEFLRN